MSGEGRELKECGTPTVAEIKEQLTALEFRLAKLKAELSPTAPNSAAPTPFQINEQAVRRLVKARRLREQLLGEDLFADPAWDILLEAFAAELGQRRISVSDLCIGSAVPATTALRWINYLEQHNWLVRVPDQVDARRSWIELKPQGSERLRRYFATIWPNLLPV